MHTYHEYFSTAEIEKLIYKYSKWLIKLRYFAFAVLALFIFFIDIVDIIEVSNQQFNIIFSVSVLILLYNIGFESIKTKSYFVTGTGPVKLASLQILFDLFALSVVIYFSGGIESPLFLFYIFHIVLGSILLPELIIYPLGLGLGLLLTLLSLLENYGLIPHHKMIYLEGFSFYNSFEIVIGISVFFLIVILFTIIITKRLANEIFDKEIELQKAEQNKQKYIVAIVHELKSPIAAAASFMDLVIDGYSGNIDEPAKVKLLKAKERISESITNINDILNISRFKLSKEILKEEVNLDKVINNIFENAESIADKKKLKLERNLDNIGKIQIVGDAKLLQLAFSNVIHNAIKYTPDNGMIKISYKLYRTKVNIDIEDNGQGIDKKDLNKIFVENYRTSSAMNSTIEGTGTGLAVVKRIIENHGGKITAESPSNIGSTDRPGSLFRVTLPIN